MKCVQQMRPMIKKYETHLKSEAHLIATFFDVRIKKKEGQELELQKKVSSIFIFVISY